MTKKELQTLKQEYSNKVFDTWYDFYKMKKIRTKENEDSYNRRLYTEIVVEEILEKLKINSEKITARK